MLQNFAVTDGAPFIFILNGCHEILTNFTENKVNCIFRLHAVNFTKASINSKRVEDKK